MNYRVVPIPAEITRKVREKMVSPQYGHPAFAEPAKGYGPCRQCLKTFREGLDERILFTYNAFENLSDLPLPGPVFIHGHECKTFDEEGFPPELRDLPMLFEGFAEKSRLVVREPVEKENINEQIDEIFARQEVEFIYLRNREAGCFIARLERL